VLSVATAVTLGCNRAEPVEDSAPAAASAEQQREKDVEQLERRFEEIERDWNQTVAAVSNGLEPAAAELRDDLQEDVARLRDEIEQLRTTTAKNWWERQERELERAAEEVERDVRRVARDWRALSPEAAVGTVGTDATWEARRDRLVARLERRIEAMAAALEDTSRQEDREDRKARVDQTRARLQQMKDDTDRLRTASDDDWWQVTKQRIDTSLDRIAAELRQLKKDLG
jgi:TolA-binding protein